MAAFDENDPEADLYDNDDNSDLGTNYQPHLSDLDSDDEKNTEDFPKIQKTDNETDKVDL